MEQNSPSEDLKTQYPQFSWKNYFYWAVFDFANTFYSTGLFVLVALSWFLVIGQQSGLSYLGSNNIFSVGLIIAGVLTATTLPIVGSHVDFISKKKYGVIVATIVALIFLTGVLITRNLVLAIIAYIISIITYNWGGIYYDSMLPKIAPPGREGTLSAIAVGFGFFGGIVPILLAGPLSSKYGDPVTEGAEVTLGYFPWIVGFIIVGFVLLTIPMFFVEEIDWGDDGEKELNPIKDNPEEFSFKKIFADLYESFVDIATNNRGMLFYILGYFVIADIANLLGFLVVEYLRILEFGESEITFYLAMGYVGLLLFTYIIGKVIDRGGAKHGFRFLAVLWFVGFSFFLSFQTITDSKFVFLLATLFVIPATAGVWICQRQMVLELAPSDKEIGKYFGFTKFSGKLAAALGPFLWIASFSLFSSIFPNDRPHAFRLALIILVSTLFVGFAIVEFMVPNKFNEFRNRRMNLHLANK